ncbi:MAG: NAD(P)/FAD-dependent oxidoreductase, partial [Flavobacteriales bacterium]
MSKILSLTLSPENAAFDDSINNHICKELNASDIEPSQWKILKKSIDARKKEVKIQLRIEVFEKEIKEKLKIEKHYKDVSNSEEVIIIGSGPAGLFAALTLLERGKKPIIFERGKDVRIRRRDIAAINKNHIVNPESNYCFGEGGAGTYSDGKLYTRSKKRGSIIDILETLVFHGAKEDILIEAQPHIGTNKLPKIIANIRETILSHGGEIHFDTKVVDFIIESNTIKGVVLQNNDKVLAKNTILATGHSARDIFK